MLEFGKVPMISTVDWHNNNVIILNRFFLQKSLYGNFLAIERIGYKKAIGNFNITARLYYKHLKQLSIYINHIIVEPLSEPYGCHGLMG